MFEAGRCLVPADGFFEWHGPKHDRRPIWFHAPSNGLLLLAGLFSEQAQGLPTFTVLTTDANPVVVPIHDRMPVILEHGQALEWLETPSSEVLKPAREGLLVATAVSPRVNSVKNDDPSCLAPPSGPPGTDQLKLF
jgi:putative SOS response-associated peptidase YedK